MSGRENVRSGKCPSGKCPSGKCPVGELSAHRLGRRSEDDERQINRWKKIVSRFSGNLFQMIRDAGSKFNDYSISARIRKVLLHWGYELTAKDFFNQLTN